MARRRLNTKVFAVLIGVIVVGGMSLFAAHKLLGRSRGDPRQLEADGDAQMAKADYEQATARYAQAADRDPTNPGLKLKLGDALVRQVKDDTANLGSALRAWNDAVALDPTYAPALDRLMSSVWEQIDLAGGLARPETYQELRKRCEQMLKADPANEKAAVWRHVATVQQALAGQAVPTEDLDASTAALARLAAKNPADPEPPYYLAQAKLRQARELLSARPPSPGPAADAAAAAADLMTRAADAQPGVARMQFRAAQVLNAAARVDPQAADRKYGARATDYVGRAMAVAKPGDSKLDDITFAAADARFAAGKPDEARALLRKFYEDHPNDQRARLIWAQQLAGKREDHPAAVALLSQEVPVPAGAVGFGVIAHRELQAQTLLALVQLRLSDADAEADPAKRAAVLAAADADMDKLRKLASPKAVRVLALEGQVLLAKGQAVEAVKAMEEAYEGMAGGAKDWDLVLRLAQAYAGRTRQPGLARRLCEELVGSASAGPAQALPARALLAQLLLEEYRLSAAQEQLAAIERLVPDPKAREALGYSRLASTLNIMALGSTKPGPEADRQFAAIPEATNPQRWAKVNFAQALSKPDEQIRLLTDVLKTDPKDLNGVRALATLYKQQEAPDRARRVLEQGLADNKGDVALQAMLDELNGVSQDNIRKGVRQGIETTVTDPFDRALRLYQFEKQPGGSAEAALAQLLAAAKLRPNDPQTTDLLFKEYLDRGRIEDAKVQLSKLTELNADQVGGRLYKHRLAIATRDFPEAERVGLDLVTTFREFAQSWLALGQAQTALGKWPEAARSYSEVLVRQPTHYEALRLLVNTLYNAGRTEEAEGRLRDMRRLFPNDPTVRELFLNHLANFGSPQEAIPDREEQVAKNPKEAWPYLALAATYFKNAQKLAAESKPDDSKAEITKAFDTLRKGQALFPDQTEFYAQSAEIHQYNGRIDQAELVLNQYAERELTKPKPRPDPWLAKADFFGRAGQPGKAAAALAEALARSDNDLNVRLRLASAQVQAKQFADAQATLDAVKDSPDPRVARQRIEVLIARGSLDVAERDVRAALANRDGADLRNLLASVLIDSNRPADAAPELERALALDPTNEAARYLRALALVKKQPPEMETAVAELVDLKKSAPRNMQVLLLLAELYDKTGRRAQAIPDLDAALKDESMRTAPGIREVRLALIKLYRNERPPRTREALELAAKAEADPVLQSDPAWPREAALAYLQTRRYQEAVMKMTKAVQLAKGPAATDYRRELVDILIQFNDVAGAMVETDRLLRDGVDTWWLRQQRGVATGKQVTRRMLDEAKAKPEVARQVADLQAQAVAEFDRATSLSDGLGDEEQTANVYRTMGQTVGNEVALKRIAPRLANDPTNRWKLLALGLKRAGGDYAGAIADAERMLADPANAPPDAAGAAADPKAAAARVARRGPILRAAADTYQNQPVPDLAKARARYEELVKLVPNDVASLNNLAYMLAESVRPPDPQAAKAYSERAYDLVRRANDPNPLVVDTHGWVLVLCGGDDLSRGVQVLGTLVEQNPLFAEGQYHLGEALLRQAGQPTARAAASAAGAEKAFAECLRLTDEEEKLGGSVNEGMRGRAKVGLSKARDLGKAVG